MFCSKHVDVKRHSVYFPEIKKTFAVSFLVSNLLASQTGDFFLPHSVHRKSNCPFRMYRHVPMSEMILLPPSSTEKTTKGWGEEHIEAIHNSYSPNNVRMISKGVGVLDGRST